MFSKQSEALLSESRKEYIVTNLSLVLDFSLTGIACFAESPAPVFAATDKIIASLPSLDLVRLSWDFFLEFTCRIEKLFCHTMCTGQSLFTIRHADLEQ